MNKTFKGFTVRLAMAACVPTASFWISVLPISSTSLRAAAGVLWHILDAPTSALNLLLPGSVQSGFARQFASGTYCFPQSLAIEFGRYLRVGLPAWLAVLFVPAAAKAMVHYFADRHRKAHAKQGQLGV